MDNDRSELRASRYAMGVLAALVSLVVLANVLWPNPAATGPVQPRLQPSDSPFPMLEMGPNLTVATLDSEANLSTRLLLASLQGLVNRAQVELYIDTIGVAGNTSSILSFLATEYSINLTFLTAAQAIDRYASRANGLAVYDPSAPASVNVATMFAAQLGAALVGPDWAPSLSRSHDLEVLFDYRTSDWVGLDSVGVADRALRELYPGSSPNLLAILPPDGWAIRDYLVATRTFVFYLPQGVLASPLETAATNRILQATSRGIPILGWFDTPTITEENMFVQMVSRAGKSVVGVRDVPNLSVLTALGRNVTRVQASTPASLPLEDKTYVVLAVSDGDNVDFVSGRMRDLWSGPERGTIPIAWTMNPYLADLAPPLLDWYYRTMSPLDRFVVAPSGAGYLYPDYADPEDLRVHLERSARYATATDMDVVWLLNAFPASEIVYTDASLSAYVDAMRPEGIVLDYADQPRSRDMWMQAGLSSAAPVVRSTHFWTTRENFLGKLEAARAAWDGGPQFVWLTVYPFRFDLDDAEALLEELRRRTGDQLVLVTPTQLFQLMREDFIDRARARVAAARSDPTVSSFFDSFVRSAERNLAHAEALRAGGDVNRAAHAAYLAVEDLRALEAMGALLAAALAIAVMAAFVLAVHPPRMRRSAASAARVRSFIFVVASLAFFFLALREAVLQNFWTYGVIVVGVLVVGLAAPVRRRLDLLYPGRAPVAAAIFLLLAASLAIHTTAAFPLAIVATLVALDSVLVREPLPPTHLVASFGIGIAIGFMSPFTLPVLTILAVLLVGAPSTMPEGQAPTPETARPRGRGFAAMLVVLPLSALAIPSSYVMSLLLDQEGFSLTILAAALLGFSGLAAWCADRLLPPRDPSRLALASLGLAVVLCGVFLLARGTLAVTLALLALLASLAFAAMSGVRTYVERGGAAREVLVPAVALVPLLFLFVRMPPIVYSLALVPLPEPIEFALYTPIILVALAALFVALYGWTRGRLGAPVGKH